MESPEFTLQIALVLAVVLVTIILFITEWLRVDVVAILVMISLPLMGLVDGREAFRGLSSTAVISIIAVIIMGRGLDHTGIINRSVKSLLRFAGSVGVDPRLAALVVGLAASNAFLLPTHQVNALYMGPGGYTTLGFIKAGAPLSILFLLVLVAVVTLFY